jgi:hypothetical protein
MVAAPGKEKGVLSLLTVAFPRSFRGAAIRPKPMAGMAIRGNFERHSKETELITKDEKERPRSR